MFTKKLLLIILTFFCCTLAIQAQNGTGTSTDPYQISNVDDLKSFRDNVNNISNYSTGAFFVLVADIDLSAETNWEPIGTTSANRFDGNFDGRGHVIKNLQIIGTASNVGLFAYTGSNAVIKNVGVETTLLGVNGGQNVGILVGNQRGSKISNCYVSGSVSGTDAGGLIGGQAAVSGNSVDQCYAFVNVNSSGGNGAGGLIGVSRGQLTNSYVFGNMTAISSSNGMINVSGLVGVVSNDGIVENCYSTGNLLAISNDGRAGGVVGTISQPTASIKNNFAANASIENTNVSNDKSGRVIGYPDQGTFANDYANQDMSIILNGNPKTIIPGLDTKEGASQSLSTFKNYAFYTTGGNWDTSSWSIFNTDNNTMKWNIWDGYSYPYLQTQSAPVAETMVNTRGELRNDVAFDSIRVYKKTGNVLTYLGLANINNAVHAWSYVNSSLSNLTDSITLIAYENGKTWPSYPVSVPYQGCTGPLNGTYTIPGDFISLKAAADVYNSCGITANSTLQIVSDLMESDTVKFLGTAPGSTDYTLTITTDGQRRTVSSSIKGPVIQLVAANNITFDGIVPADSGNATANKLIIKNTNTNIADVPAGIFIQKDAVGNDGMNVVLKNTEVCLSENLYLYATNNRTNVTDAVFITAENVLVDGCYLHHADNALEISEVANATIQNNVTRNTVFHGIIVKALDPVWTGALFDYTISGNTILDLKGLSNASEVSGIYFDATDGKGNLSITDNTLDNLSRLPGGNSLYFLTGIVVYFDGAINIEKDHILNMDGGTAYFTTGMVVNGSAAGTVMIDSCSVKNMQAKGQTIGIKFQNLSNDETKAIVQHCLVDNIIVNDDQAINSNRAPYGIVGHGGGTIKANTISNLINASTNGASNGLFAFGIELVPNAAGVRADFLVSNNMFSGIRHAGNAGSLPGAVSSIYTLQDVSAKIYHNTVLFNGNDANTYVIGLLFDKLSSGTEIKNNLIVSNDANDVLESYMVGVSSGGLLPSGFSRDNIFYTNPGLTNGMIAYAGSFVYATLEDWNTASGDNARSVLPTFAGSDDLHLAGASITDPDLGVPLLSGLVENDFDGDLRSACTNAAGADNYNVTFSITDLTTDNTYCDRTIFTVEIENGISSDYQYSVDNEVTWTSVSRIVDDSTLEIEIFPRLSEGSSTLFVKNLNDCVVSESFTITSVPTIAFEFADTVTCAPSTVDLTELTLESGDTLGLTFKYYDSQDVELTNTIISTVGVFTYKIVGTNSKGCSHTSTVSVTINPSATISVVDPSAICAGSSVDLATAVTTTDPTIQYFTANDGTGELLGADIIVSPATTTTYYAQATTAAGCKSVVEPIVVTVNPLPVVSVSHNQTPAGVCMNTDVVFSTESGNSNYVWTVDGATVTAGADATSNTATLKWTTAGTKTVTVNYENANGCKAVTAASVTLLVNPEPVANAVSPLVICAKSSQSAIALSGTNVTYYTWTGGSSVGITDNTATGQTSIPAFTAANVTTVTTASIQVVPHYVNGAVTCDGDPVVFSVTVNPATAINTQPSVPSSIKLPNGYIIPGSNVVLTVVAVGHNLTYQWYKDVNGTVTTLTNSGKYSGATSSQLTISNAYETEDGSYYVTVTGTCNTVTSTSVAVVTVANQDASLKDLKVNGTTVPEFDPAHTSYAMTISCDTEQVSLLGIANNAGASVAGNGTFSLQPGDNYFTITVTAQDMVTTMTYTVNVIRSCYVPKIIKDLEDAVVCINGSHTWSIEAEGENLTYEWYCGFNRIQGANTNSITISNAKLTDYERYYVVVRSNLNGFKSSVYSKRVKLWVANYLPDQLKFAEYPNPATVGKTYQIKVDGYSDVTRYAWSYDKEGVSFSPEIGKETENETWATFGTLSEGTGALKVILDHPCGKREITQAITVQYPTGVEDVTATVVTVYPNPTSGIVKVSNTQSGQLIRILDVTGSLKATCPSQEGTTTIDLTGYAKGTYMVQYNGKTYKVIKR